MKIASTPVTIQVSKEIATQANGLIAWVYDKSGKLLEKHVIENGQAKLKIDSRSLRAKAKIYISPPLPEQFKKAAPSERLLIQAGAYQPSLRLREGGILDLLTIPDLDRFRFRFCTITGSVSKNFTFDGISKILPVCNIRIHICEVDPFWFVLPKIPDLEIIDIRDHLREVIIRENQPQPIPDPIGPISRPILASPPKASLVMNRLPPALPTTALKLLSYDSADVLRKNLQSNYRLFLPYLCLFPKRWPFLYSCEEIAVVQSDCNGRFEHKHFYIESGDHPDIYIWIEANINGNWETVYRPPIACSTHWDYPCGSDINISIKDDRLRPCECEAMPGQVVWMKRVGDGQSIRRIQQTEVASNHLQNAVGLIDAYRSGEFTSPFGSGFPFVVQFGSGFPSATTSHYRWKYRQLKSANLTDALSAVQNLEGAIFKPYTFERINSDGDTVFYSDALKLGPELSPQGSIFRIPHVEASVDIPGEPTAEWNQDTYSVNVNSLNLNDGLYEFIFELVDSNGNVVPQDKDIFVVDKKSNEVANPVDATTVSAFGRPEGYLLLNAAQQAIGFRFVMRIDNDPCFADIKNALVDGNATGSECGFGQYANKTSSTVTLKFEASHPQHFGYYSFGMVRGNSNTIPTAAANAYLTQSHNGYISSNDVFSKNLPVAEILGNCNEAAFAETLHVYATHTNGSRILQEYDRSDVAAIAIKPAP